MLTLGTTWTPTELECERSCERPCEGACESACDVLYICTLYFGTITKVNINTNYIDTSTWYLKYRCGTGTNTGTELADSKWNLHACTVAQERSD